MNAYSTIKQYNSPSAAEALPLRKIIHIDCDCFYASLEMLDNPSLRNHPIAVGGEPSRRGVIATCNYQARSFGVHSAMASSTAKRLCQKLIIVPPRMKRYKEASQHIHQIFKRFTSTFEPLSLDEAFLDVTDKQEYQGSATLMAQAIREQINPISFITALMAVCWSGVSSKGNASANNCSSFLFVLKVKPVAANRRP